MEKLTFDKVPEAIGLILERLAEIEKILSMKKEIEEEHKELMDVTEAAAFLKFTKSTIYTKVSRGALPCYKAGKKLFFKKSELIGYLELHKKMSNYQLQKEADLRIRHLPRTRKYTY